VGAFSLASTVLTFFPSLGLHRFRWVALVCLIGAFAWANLRVFQKQQGLVQDLQSRLAPEPARRAQLVLGPRGGSTYIVVWDPAGKPKQIYVELNLAIENKGNRTSNVVGFQLHIIGTDHPFSGLEPSYRTNIQGIKSAYGLSGTGLGMAGHITIPAEQIANGNLAFYVPFVPEGVLGDLRKPFDPIDCKLTVTDTEGVTAAHDFHLAER
jgi:hypothetical protein